MSTTRQITMTISKIEANLIEITTLGEPERWTPGYIRVTAYGEGEFHSWQLDSDQRCWIGDRVTVTIIEDDPELVYASPPTPPPIDKRTP